MMYPIINEKTEKSVFMCVMYVSNNTSYRSWVKYHIFAAIANIVYS